VGGACSTKRGKRNAHRLLVGKTEGKRPLGRQRRRGVDNIRPDLGEIEWDGVDWIGLAQERNRWRALVNAVMNLRVPPNAGNFSSGCRIGGLSSSIESVTYLKFVFQFPHVRLNFRRWVRVPILFVCVRAVYFSSHFDRLLVALCSACDRAIKSVKPFLDVSFHSPTKFVTKDLVRVSAVRSLLLLRELLPWQRRGKDATEEWRELRSGYEVS
jgi:hypothetical protein